MTLLMTSGQNLKTVTVSISQVNQSDIEFELTKEPLGFRNARCLKHIVSLGFQPSSHRFQEELIVINQ